MIYDESSALAIISFFKAKGIPSNGISAILGNFYAESSLRPNNAQNSYVNKFATTDEAYTQAVDGGYWKRPDNGTPFQADSIGYGLAQWTSSGRKTKLYDFAREKRVSISNLSMQLEFAYSEMQTSYKKTINALLTQDIETATVTMMTDYERPADKDNPAKQATRVSYAKEFYAKYLQEEKVMANKLIAISAGHYLGTPGKRCLKSIDPNETREWVLNSRIAEYLTALLMPYEVDILRLDDPTGKTEVTLESRAKKSNSAKADFYLAIHHNAGINGGKGGGIVVYHYPNARGKNNATDLYNRLISRTGLKGNRATPIASTDKLYEVAVPVAPALLLENGFMDSTVDTPIILTDDFARKAADGLAEFFIKMWGLKKKDIPSATYNPSAEIQEIREQLKAIEKKLTELEAKCV